MSNKATHQRPRRQVTKAGAGQIQRKYATIDGSAAIVGGEQFFCPSCGEAPPNLPADQRIPFVHPGGMPVTNPATGFLQILCGACYYRVLTNIVPVLVKVDANGDFKPHYVIPDDIQVRMGMKEAPEPEAEAETEGPEVEVGIDISDAVPAPSPESGLVLAR